MKVLLLVAAMSLPLVGQPTAQEILQASRAALGGSKLDGLQSLSAWGPYRRGGQSTILQLSLELSGKILKEQTSFSSGGQVQRLGVGDEGTSSFSGGMPGDDGGPALVAGALEALNGDNYWSRMPGAQRVDGNALEPAAALRKREFIQAFARYALAFTLSPPANFPVSFVYAGRVETPGHSADVVDGIGRGDFAVRLFLDSKSRLPLLMSYHDSGREVQIWLKDYRTESGILFPHVVTWVADGALMEEFQAQRFRVNPRFHAGKFGRR